ncbi:MAG: thiamine biosynthesis protein ThiF [Chloroflexi bacterium]|nr:thiamine biosynthesis protein ThiF [Chloroflexota bacterium]
MNLQIEQRYKVVFGESDIFRILLVGVGGTGSYLADALASLAIHARQKGVQVELTLVDPDIVEHKNVGRQQWGFSEAAQGVSKAQSRALRLNAAYGLDIAAWPQAYTMEMGRNWYKPSRAYGHSYTNIIVGCVDNTAARQEIARTVVSLAGGLFCVDCGNAEWNGQVLAGNVSQIDTIRFDQLGLCTGLPSPYQQEPDLLQPEPKPTDAAISCADLTLREEQSLLVNRLTAAIAAQYCANIILRRELTQMSTYFNLEPTVMTPRFITRDAVETCRPSCENQRD